METELDRIFGAAAPYMKTIDFSSILTTGELSTETVTVGSITYTFGTEVLIGSANVAEVVRNLADAINAHPHNYNVTHKNNVANLEAWALARGKLLQVTGRILEHDFTCTTTVSTAVVASYSVTIGA